MRRDRLKQSATGMTEKIMQISRVRLAVTRRNLQIGIHVHHLDLETFLFGLELAAT